jgi:hypothetical protein
MRGRCGIGKWRDEQSWRKFSIPPVGEESLSYGHRAMCVSCVWCGVMPQAWSDLHDMDGSWRSSGCGGLGLVLRTSVVHCAMNICALVWKAQWLTMCVTCCCRIYNTCGQVRLYRSPRPAEAFKCHLGRLVQHSDKLRASVLSRVRKSCKSLL